MNRCQLIAALVAICCRYVLLVTQAGATPLIDAESMTIQIDSAYYQFLPHMSR